MWKNIIRFIAFASLTFAVQMSFAASCPQVTENSGQGPGSLPIVAAGNCSPITFAPQLETVEVSFPVFIKANTVLDGENHITLVPAHDFPAADQGILQLSNNASSVQNVTISHPNGWAISITKSGNIVTGCRITNSAIGIYITNGDFNFISNNSFSGITDTAIQLDNVANENLSSPQSPSAQMIDDSTWELTGTVSAETTDVEFYLNDENGLNIAQGITLLTVEEEYIDNNFSARFNVNEVNPNQAFTLLAFDARNNTSAFSEVIIPIEEQGFFPPEMEACADAAWFLDDAWTGDSDGDGLSNEEEDTNHNCVADEGESLPDFTDSDGDRISDAEDNCPANANHQQIDSDGDDIGNECDPEFNPPVTPPPGGNGGGVVPPPTPQVEDPFGDNDGDRFINSSDNCPDVPNHDQVDSDDDGLGDACDADASVSKGNGGGCQLAANNLAPQTNLNILLLISLGGMMMLRKRNQEL